MSPVDPIVPLDAASQTPSANLGTARFSPEEATHGNVEEGDVMIRVICGQCGSKLNAKDKLAGQTRKCPKCKAAIHIPPPGGESIHDEDVDVTLGNGETDQHAQPAGESNLRHLLLPEKLDRNNRYLICDRTRFVACWENNGQGWMLKLNTGLVQTSRNQALLPSQGDFKLVELQLKNTGAGLRISGLVSFQLALHWALTELGKGDNQITSAITGLGSLNRDQKNVVRKAMKDQFMHEVWKDAQNVLEYLDSTDYHSPGPK